MALYHVLLNGTGTNGDGSTWDDASDATSAYIGQSGFGTISATAAAGDIIFAKGVESTTLATTLGPSSVTLARAQNPVQILGCKSATTNEGVSIVTADLIDGIRNGGAATPAYDDADVPTLTLTSTSSDITIRGGLYIYGVKFVTGDNINIFNSNNSLGIFEECELEASGSGDLLINTTPSSRIKTIQSKFTIATGGGMSFAGEGEHHKSIFSCSGNAGILGNLNGGQHSTQKFIACEFTGGETTIISKGSTVSGVRLENCKFPTSWVFTGGTAVGAYRYESYGSDDTAGLTTGGSEQQINIEDQHGTIVTETTKVRTGGADDGATGIVSWDMSTFANGTALSVAGLESPWMYIWVAGDGTSQTVTVYFSSDTGNTEAANWTSDEVWLEVEYPDDGGTSQYDYDSSVANLLAAGSVVTDGTDGQWAAGGVRAQELSQAISPDYEGYVKCRVVFAPGANAETIYVDPLPVVT